VLKYRFLCLSIFLRMLIYMLTPTSEYYILLSQGCPFNLIHFSIMSLLLISDIMFLIDYTYYYITLDCFINVRLEKNKYYTIILKKVISGTIILFISSLLIPYYNADALLQVVLDKMTLLVIFSIMLMTCIKYKKTDGIILCYFIIVLLRYLIALF
jgi:hypothetical protein